MSAWGRERHTGDDYDLSRCSRAIRGTGYLLELRDSLKSALVGDGRDELLAQR